MPNLLWIYLELVLVGVSSFGVAYLLTRWRSNFHRVAPPRAGTVFRISIGTALLRTRLADSSNEAWRFDPPVSSTPDFDLAAGQMVSGEYPSQTGLLRFRSEISEVEFSGHFSVKTPLTTRLVERRSEPRDSKPGNVLIEQNPSVCIDLSPLGGRFETPYTARRGERIRLDFPQVPQPIFGWVLEIYPNQIRVRFEDRLPYLK